MSTKKVAAIAVAMLALGASGAWAEDDVIEGVINACKPEIEAYCSQVTPGEGRLLACFYAHGDKLSGRCEYALYDAAAQLEQFAAAVTHLAIECHDDLLSFCGDVQMGEGRVADCLLDHRPEVSEQCSAAIDDVGLKRVEE